MVQFRKAQLIHEEWVMEIAGRDIPVAALRTALTGLAMIGLILAAYFNGQQVQQQTLNWFAWYSGKGMCHVMPSGQIFIVVCGQPTNTTSNMTNISLVTPT